MKLPNAGNATVAQAKITRYLLDPTSERGQDKARFFSAFGFTIETWQVMEEALKQHALTHPVASVRETEHGSNYSIEGELVTPDGRNPAIRTIWIIRTVRIGRNMRPFDSIILKDKLTNDAIPVGTRGAIVEELVDGLVFIVEFFDADGNTLDVVEVNADQLTVILADFHPDDPVALMEDIPQHNLRRGQVGKIRSRTAIGRYDVEFTDDPTTVVNLHAQQLLLLYLRESTGAI